MLILILYITHTSGEVHYLPNVKIFVDDGLNVFLNENWELLFEELKPSFEDALGQIFKDITHRVFSKLPLHKIFIMS